MELFPHGLHKLMRLICRWKFPCKWFSYQKHFFFFSNWREKKTHNKFARNVQIKATHSILSHRYFVPRLPFVSWFRLNYAHKNVRAPSEQNQAIKNQPAKWNVFHGNERDTATHCSSAKLMNENLFLLLLFLFYFFLHFSLISVTRWVTSFIFN